MRRAIFLLLLLAGTVLLGLAAAQEPAGLLKAWLVVWLAATGPAIGAVFVALLGRLAPGPWYRRIAQETRALCLALPLASLGVVPVLLGLDTLYAWTDPHAHAGTLVAARGAWQAEWAFILRQIAWLGTLGAIGLALGTRRLARRGPAGAAAILAGLAATGFAFDISMSLDPAFHSSIFGLYVIAGQGAGGLGAILLLAAAKPGGGEALRGRPAWLLFGACALWGYHAFMQYLVIWSGDLPHLAAWYLDRNQGAWLALLCAVCALFAAPAALLLRGVRRSRAGGAAVAGLVLAASLLETVWRIAPDLGLSACAWAGSAGLVLAGLGLAGFSRAAARAREAAHG